MSEQVTTTANQGIKKGLLAGALALLLLALPGLVMAYPGGGGQPGMGAEAAPQDFDQATLQSFAVASVQLQEIQQEYAGRLEGVQDQDKAIELQQQANEKMVATVEEEGLDVQTYNAIANAMNTSPELHARIMAKIEAEQNR
ncbi:DUF4168 domain-containing protein [Desulfurivibrio alkaliphilus]|uniref:DUF4168 domain-containing protein n=1 Tax=Desulfurivibrio alkaliphilus (strain DSM 19089 / UNIQEM U267 / AHT2) TaxID=589865 RepID=D6Z4S5_DESAT|nr:DUF4168 domain-containing protein [Desulfurivibrio alkaliphilus]ADH86550.1 hypothetical protein DaAHT2_1870 [Desulfurivibrio alkaliphilus AHT 2]